MLSLGATEIKIRYAGGSLASAINYMKASHALTILPHSVVFAYRKERAIAALSLDLPHPERALAHLRSSEALRSPAVDAFVAHISQSVRELKHLIKRHEEAVIWGV